MAISSVSLILSYKVQNGLSLSSKTVMYWSSSIATHEFQFVLFLPFL